MSRKSRSVRELAQEADLDLDEALVALWDAGIENVLDPDDLVPQRLVGLAQRALGLPTTGRETSVAYWHERSTLEFDAFRVRLGELGIQISSNSRKMPKGSVRKLRRAFIEPPLSSSPAQVEPELPPLHWESVGNTPSSHYLDEDQVLAIHEALVEEFRSSADPISPEGVHDLNLLRSALTRPYTSIGDIRKYPTVEMAGAALVHSLVHNHPFFNGNKRTAFVSLLAVLDEHQRVLTCNEDELFKFMMRVGQHGLVPISADELSDREVMEIARWIRSNSRSLEYQERPMRWHRLKQRLREHECKWEPAPGGGSRLNIWREIPRRGIFHSKVERLHVQVGWAGDGTEADRVTIRELRRRLKLDDENDVDSAMFYAGAEVDGFILEHRRILQRLARF